MKICKNSIDIAGEMCYKDKAVRDYCTRKS